MISSSGVTGAADGDYAARQEALARRVAEAAQAISAQNLRPTVARVRAALGGGSPNDLAPALKSWKASAAGAKPSLATPSMPVPIADLAQELWARATVAATVALRNSPAAQLANTQNQETDSLREQVNHLRAELEREVVMYGELRAQGARHEAIARDALARLSASEARERKYLRELGGARQLIAELEAQWQLQDSRGSVSKPTSEKSRSRSCKAPPPGRTARNTASRQSANRPSGSRTHPVSTKERVTARNLSARAIAAVSPSRKRRASKSRRRLKGNTPSTSKRSGRRPWRT